MGHAFLERCICKRKSPARKIAPTKEIYHLEEMLYPGVPPDDFFLTFATQISTYVLTYISTYTDK
jgi:hypothetical protein